MDSLSYHQLVKIAGFTAVGCTLAINPWFAYDPINLPKMLVLNIGAILLGCALLFNLRILRTINKWILFLFGTLFVFLTLSLLINSAPLNQQIFGTWGRSTGYLTYVSFLLIALSVAVFANRQDFSTLRVYLEKLSYFVSFYTAIQWADLDPINWSQKLMIATLGNLNFMSSFLGIACCSFLVRVFLEKIPVSSKLFFIFMAVINLLLIYVSGSIQGIAIFAAGLSLVFSILVKERFGTRKALFSLVIMILLGVLTFFGTLGQGPLSMLRQETVLFRLDYWRAGLSMTINNPLIGVGVDSYGDFYREYRNLGAVERTGPQRVTNTAHNIFLDVSSGAGLVAGISFFLIVSLVIVLMLRRIFKEHPDKDTIAWTIILIGFSVFCLISINQIGVGIWGFIALGILINSLGKQTEDSSESSRSKSRRAFSQGKVAEEVSGRTVREESRIFLDSLIFKNFITIVSTGAVLFFAVSANVTDAQFLSAIKSNNLQKASDVTRRFTAMDFHKEVLISRLTSAGRDRESLELAMEVVGANPRNWASWVAIVESDLSSVAQKQRAAMKLFDLDPNNKNVRDELTTFLESLASVSR